jgi:AraC-like DNA-binding protein
MSAHEFLLRLRIQEAAKLLLGTDLPLVEIALQCGFQNQPHFTTVFKKMTDVTPRRWRNARRGLPTPSVEGLRRRANDVIELSPNRSEPSSPEMH